VAEAENSVHGRNCTNKLYRAETYKSQNCGFRLQQQNFLAMADHRKRWLYWLVLLTSLMVVLRATCSGETRSALMSQKT